MYPYALSFFVSFCCFCFCHTVVFPHYWLVYFRNFLFCFGSIPKTKVGGNSLNVYSPYNSSFFFSTTEKGEWKITHHQQRQPHTSFDLSRNFDSLFFPKTVSYWITSFESTLITLPSRYLSHLRIKYVRIQQHTFSE